jgi:hypothetical protein
MSVCIVCFDHLSIYLFYPICICFLVSFFLSLFLSFFLSWGWCKEEERERENEIYRVVTKRKKERKNERTRQQTVCNLQLNLHNLTNLQPARMRFWPKTQTRWMRCREFFRSSGRIDFQPSTHLYSLQEEESVLINI